MIKLKNIQYIDYEKYDGKNAAVLSDGKIVKGKLSYEDSRFFFCCNDPQFDGYTCTKKYGYIYSWNLSSGQYLDGIALKDGEELDIPELRFSKLSISGSKISLKLSDEVYEKLKVLKDLGNINLLEDFVITFNSSSRFVYNCVEFKISETNTEETIDFGNSYKRVYKRFLSYYLPEVEMEGCKYKIIYPYCFDNNYITFLNILMIKKRYFIQRIAKGCLNEYIDEFFKKGFVLPVKASSKEEYIQKAVNYLYKLGCKLFRIKKDDCDNYILTNLDTWISKKGTKYINAKNFDNEGNRDYDWVKESDCIQVYDSGIYTDPTYYVNNDKIKRMPI